MNYKIPRYVKLWTIFQKPSRAKFRSSGCESQHRRIGSNETRKKRPDLRMQADDENEFPTTQISPEMLSSIGRRSGPRHWRSGALAKRRAPEQKLTFRELKEKLRRSASFFHQLGLRRGDRVLIIAPRVTQWWIAMLGLIRLGVVPIPGTPLLTGRDIKYRLEASDAAALITDEEGTERRKGCSWRIGICTSGEPRGWTNFDTGLRQADPDFDPEPTRGEDPGLIYFTSAQPVRQRWCCTLKPVTAWATAFWRALARPQA